MRKIFLMAAFVTALCAQAHEVKTIYAELSYLNDEQSLVEQVIVDVYYDVSLSLVEWQGDEIPAPTREWLLFEPQETYERIRAGAIKYVQEHLSLVVVGLAELESSVTFPDFETNPPSFPQQRDGYAYTMVRMVWDKWDVNELNMDKKFELKWNHPEQDLVLKAQVKDKAVHYKQLMHQQTYAWATQQLKSEKSTAMNQTLTSWFHLGFTHIIPKGWDHLLFVAGLFFLARSKKELLTQSLLFTMAHSVVLALMALGFVVTTPTWIEIGIAMSIIYIGVEAYLLHVLKFKWLKRVARWRTVVIALFGLVHGFAFAEILQGYFDQESQVWLALLGFNLGIEVAQMLIILGLALLSFMWIDTRWKKQVPIYACYAIAVMGMVWLAQRIV